MVASCAASCTHTGKECDETRFLILVPCAKILAFHENAGRGFRYCVCLKKLTCVMRFIVNVSPHVKYYTGTKIKYKYHQIIVSCVKKRLGHETRWVG